MRGSQWFLSLHKRALDMSFTIADEVRSTSGIIVLLNTKHWIKVSRILFLPTRVFGHFEGKVSVINLSVSLFQITRNLISNLVFNIVVYWCVSGRESCSQNRGGLITRRTDQSGGRTQRQVQERA